MKTITNPSELVCVLADRVRNLEPQVMMPRGLSNTFNFICGEFIGEDANYAIRLEWGWRDEQIVCMFDDYADAIAKNDFVPGNVNMIHLCGWIFGQIFEEPDAPVSYETCVSALLRALSLDPLSVKKRKGQRVLVSKKAHRKQLGFAVAASIPEARI